MADLEFKTKGYFSGTYNAIGGTIKNEKTGQVLYEIYGKWNGEMYIKDVSVSQKLLITSRQGLMSLSLVAKSFYSMRRTQSTRHQWLGH